MAKTRHVLVQRYIFEDDWERLEKIGERENRPAKHQLTVLIDEACRARGVDPETLEPIQQTEVKATA